MRDFFKCDIETVKARAKWPAIIAGVLIVIIIGVVIAQGNFGHFIKNWEWVQAIGIFFVIGGVCYGRHLIAAGSRAPIDENTGEPYYPGGFSGSMFRWMIALVLGATVGTLMFIIDVIRLARVAARNIASKKQNTEE